MTKLEKFNRKYAALGGWPGVMKRKETMSWAQIGEVYGLRGEHLWRLNREFSKIDSLSGGER